MISLRSDLTGSVAGKPNYVYEVGINRALIVTIQYRQTNHPGRISCSFPSFDRAEEGGMMRPIFGIRGYLIGFTPGK